MCLKREMKSEEKSSCKTSPKDSFCSKRGSNYFRKISRIYLIKHKKEKKEIKY